jgi:hypothetical protein
LTPHARLLIDSLGRLGCCPCGLLREQLRDLHATILAAMGLAHEQLYFEVSGRQERLTGVAGSAKVIDGVLG